MFTDVVIPLPPSLAQFFNLARSLHEHMESLESMEKKKKRDASKIYFLITVIEPNSWHVQSVHMYFFLFMFYKNENVLCFKACPGGRERLVS